MSHPDLVTDDAAAFGRLDDAAADDPFTSLRFHFGMLLGVDDFETEQAYHRGQTRLHQSWLHGAGVVWGLRVELDKDRNEVRVGRGLAYDGAGRPLHLDAAACLDPGAWLDRHGDDVNRIEPPPEGADAAFDAHVEARWASCLTRPVPALAEPCEDARVETAYSRVWETIELRLVPGLADPPADRYRRVRILLGLLAPGDGPGDADAAKARADVLATAEAERAKAALAAFRAMANADAIDLAPPESDDGALVLTAAAPPAPVVLANLRGVQLRRDAAGDAWGLVGGEVELSPRRSHVASETVQELVVAALAGGPAPAPPPGPPVDRPPAEDTPEEQPPGDTPPDEQPGGETPPGEQPGGDTPPGEQPGGETPPEEQPGGETPPGEQPGDETPPGGQPGDETPPGGQPPPVDGTPPPELPAGPQVTSVSLARTRLRIGVSARLDTRTVQPAAFTVTALGDGGWTEVGLGRAGISVDEGDGSVTLALARTPAAPWQLVVRGAGPTPLLGADLEPLGGGRDHVHLERS
jgi:hypothetical protein